MHDYLDEHFSVVEYLLRVASELKLSALSKASACILYHKAQLKQQEIKNVHLDNYLVAPTCVYLASKLGEEALKIRDIVNVSYRVLHPDKDPLEIGTTYWKLRDSITTCELILLRLFAFNVSFQTPQKYLLHYLKSLEDWCNYVTFNEKLFSTLCWTLVSDACYLPLVASIPPAKLATAIIFVCQQHTKLDIMEEGEEKHWYKVFCPGTSLEELRDIGCQLLQLYEWKSSIDVKNNTGQETVEKQATSNPTPT